MSPEAARTARELQMLEGMVDCAHGLGLAFGAAAKAERDTGRSLEFLDGFLRCGFAVRMGIRLCVTLRAGPKAAPAPAVERAEAPEGESAEHDLSEREPRDGVERERDRDRDYEPVSLPKFLAALGVVARDAARLGDSLPADVSARVLPTLQGLLAQATADPPTREPAPSPAAGAAVLARPHQSDTRPSLLGSGATSLPRAGPRAPTPWPGSG
jgi:hypothetical protein